MTTKLKDCPFCKSGDVEFVWSMPFAHGHVKCKNWKDECCATGPQVHWEKYDNQDRLKARAIKKWNGE